MTAITPVIEKAIADIRSSFPECQVDAEPDGSGGAHVMVREMPLGLPYAQPTIWVGFQITFQYPYADVYPHFTCADLKRADGRALGEGLAPASHRGRPAMQISRRSNKLNPATDTAALKLLKVMQWLRTHP
ncbi:hypothetical protein [Bradyrhizobium sp. CIR3A]|uniref:hypothetical protein n=1 Tax=Bradyrhizobium sp. CIR3A TaxID=2663838 RepID=UPI0017DBDC00|nr:hypothetical protein [Bradyrhizobium sp. CIR3A]MBB4261312.1 hypothetical protein [Bradyrhizobium sp. CIR3A]